MNSQYPEQHPIEDGGGQAPRSYDDAELDALLDRTMGGIVAKLDAAFDPQSGLAGIYSRVAAGAYPPRTPIEDAGLSPARESDGSRSLQAVCDQIDTLDFCLSSVGGSTQAEPFAGAAFLEAAHPILMDLRSGLANRVLPRQQAVRLLDDVQYSFDHADQILRSQHTSLEEVLHTRLRGQIASAGTFTAQMERLQRNVIRLYDQAGDTASLISL